MLYREDRHPYAAKIKKRLSANKQAADLYHKGRCKELPRQYWQRAIHLLEVMEAVESFEELKRKGFPPNIRFYKSTYMAIMDFKSCFANSYDKLSKFGRVSLP